MPSDQTMELEPKRQPAPPRPQVTTLAVTGMTCGNCARHVTQAIQGVAEVQRAMVSLDAHEATVYWRTEPNVEAVIQAVEQEGFSAKVQEAHTHEPGHSILAGWQLNL